MTPLGEPQWCLRYSPKLVGNFSVTLAVSNASGTTVIATTMFEAIDQVNNGRVIWVIYLVHAERLCGIYYINKCDV